MKAVSEDFKGISYVRISSLPEKQRAGIAQSFDSNLIIKILKGGEVLSDCLQYNDYLAWYENIYHAKPSRPSPIKREASKRWAAAALSNLF